MGSILRVALLVVAGLVCDVDAALKTKVIAATNVATESATTGAVSLSTTVTYLADSYVALQFENVPTLASATLLRMDIQFFSSGDAQTVEQGKVYVERTTHPLSLGTNIYNVSSRIQPFQTLLQWSTHGWSNGGSVVLSDVADISFDLYRATSNWTMVVILSDWLPTSLKQFTGTPTLTLEYMDCSGVVCQNSGSCQVVDTGTSYYEVCSCPAGFQGSSCETNCTSLSNTGCENVCDISEWTVVQPCNQACNEGVLVRERSVATTLVGSECGSTKEESSCMVELCSRSATSKDKAPLILSMEIHEQSSQIFSCALKLEWDSTDNEIMDLEFFFGSARTQNPSPVFKTELSRGSQDATITMNDIVIPNNETYLWVFVRKDDGLSPYPSNFALSSALYKSTADSDIPLMYTVVSGTVAGLLLALSLFVHIQGSSSDRAAKVTLGKQLRTSGRKLKSNSSGGTEIAVDILRMPRQSTQAQIFSNPMFSLRNSQPLTECPREDLEAREADEWDYSDMLSHATSSSKGEYASVDTLGDKFGGYSALEDVQKEVNRSKRAATGNVTLRKPPDSNSNNNQGSSNYNNNDRNGEESHDPQGNNGYSDNMSEEGIDIETLDNPPNDTMESIQDFSRVLDAFKSEVGTPLPDGHEGFRRNSTSHLF